MCTTTDTDINTNGEKPPPPPPPHLFLSLPTFTAPASEPQKPAGHLFLPLPPLSEAVREAGALFGLSVPTAATGLLLYSRSAVSMAFLGSLGELPLAGGALAVASANISGYSVLQGLSLGMEPLCSQSAGARRRGLLSLTLHRSVLFLLCSALPIALLWLRMSDLLLFLGHDPDVARLARGYLLCSLPDLLSFSFIHPIRIYLRSQGATAPIAAAAAAAAALHVPANLLLVSHLGLGARGVAAAAAASNLALLLLLLAALRRDPALRPAPPPSPRACLAGWGTLARLAGPSCVSVCLEWWWYELMILLCGLLRDPRPAAASMGVLIQTTALAYVLPSSLAAAASTRVGHELGANRPSSARSAAAVATGLSALAGLAAMGFALAVRARWARLFTDDPAVLRLTAAALPVLGLCELGNCPQTVGCGVLRGSARPAHAARVNLGAFYLVGLPVAVALGFVLGVGFCGLWMGLLAAQLCCAGLMLYVVGSTDWEAQATRAQLLTYAAAAAAADANADADANASSEPSGNGSGAPEDVEQGEKRDEGKGAEEAEKDGGCYEPLISNGTADIQR